MCCYDADACCCCVWPLVVCPATSVAAEVQVPTLTHVTNTQADIKQHAAQGVQQAPVSYLQRHSLGPQGSTPVPAVAGLTVCLCLALVMLVSHQVAASARNGLTVNMFNMFNLG